MPYFEYHQSNPGGSHIYDAERGLSVNVYIEADSAEQADERAGRIGIYFDGVDDHGDCSCCGDRWDRAHRYWGDASPVDPDRIPAPEAVFVRDDNLDGFQPSKWMPEGQYDVFVHPAEGDFYGAHAELEHILRRVTGYGVSFSRFFSGTVSEVGDDGYTVDGNGGYPAPGAPHWSGSGDVLVIEKSDLRVTANDDLFSDTTMYSVWARDKAVAEGIAARAKAFVDALPVLDPDAIIGG